MELLPTPDTGGAAPAAAEPDVAERLAGVERRLDMLNDRLAELEASLAPTVAHEIQAATADVARALTELGRRLALDLPHELRRHRDAIVDELRPPPPPPPPPAPPPPVPELEEAPVLAAAAAPDEPDDAPDTGERRRGPRRRRRHG